MAAKTMKEVISRLEDLVEDAIRNNSCLGLFAQLYLMVTREVEKGIVHGRFEDGSRMERLDVCFANRYLDALDQYKTGRAVTKSWQRAFDAAKQNDLLIVQHLFMGMNAHINLDLGIAATDTVKEHEMSALKRDFDEINKILIDQIELVQLKLNRISPLLFLLDWFGKKNDEKLMEFSLKQARAQSWSAAVRLSKIASVQEKQQQIEELDSYVAVLNKLIVEPGIFSGSLIKIIKCLEEKNPSNIIQRLA